MLDFMFEETRTLVFDNKPGCVCSVHPCSLVEAKIADHATIFLFLCLSGTPTSSIGRVMIYFTWWARSPGLRRRLLQLLLLLRQVVPPHGVSLHRIPLGLLTLLLPLLRSVRRERTCLFVDSTTCSRCDSLSSGVASGILASVRRCGESIRRLRHSKTREAQYLTICYLALFLFYQVM